MPRLRCPTTSGNTIQFTPTTTFNGSASLLYSISDGSLKDTALVTITVGNAGPVAVSDVAAVTTNSSANEINVLSNDQNPDGPNPVALSVVEFPSNGSVMVTAMNKLEYSTTPGFIGTDTIIYKICETVASGPCDLPDCDTTLLAITIQNQAPVVTPDVNSTNTCDPVLTDVLGNDSDPENGSLSITNVQLTTAMAGSVSVTADNKVLYKPSPGFSGSASITYDVCDLAMPPLCTASTLTVTVSTSPAVNDTPILQNDIAENITRSDVAFIPVLQNDSDPEGTTLTPT
ncbi:MAG: Ig-like domain-containing protein, partial [Saprospiraceae bacterium]|nr:Ig-like domain-containing protein [Saprospiraceae bacterium]